MILEGGYRITADNEAQYRKFIMCIYERQKGCQIIGNPGSGKTFLFEVMQRILHPNSAASFGKVNVLEVVMDFNLGGHRVFKRWADKNMLFDDLGTEDKGKHYGEYVEVFEKFIQFRHELWLNKGIITHFTSNLTPDEIKHRYGLRCNSRLNQMTQTIILGDSPDYVDFRSADNFKGFIPVLHEKIRTAEDKEWEESYKVFCKEQEGKPYVHSTGSGTGTVLRNMVNELIENGKRRKTI